MARTGRCRGGAAGARGGVAGRPPGGGGRKTGRGGGRERRTARPARCPRSVPPTPRRRNARSRFQRLRAASSRSRSRTAVELSCLLQTGLLVGGAQSVEQRVDVAVEKLIEIVCLVTDAMIGHPVLREVVGAHPFAPVC